MTEEKELEKVKALLQSATWTFAKSMPKTPHHYTLIKHWENKEDFAFVLNYVKTHTVQQFFFGRPFHYCIIDNYKYFPMELPGKPVILINRAAVENTY